MKKTATILVLSLVLMVMPLAAYAQNPCTTVGATEVGKCVSQIYLWSLGAAGILGLIMLIVGGYLVMTASGNAQQASNGKSYIFSSVLGLAILLGAFFILYTINPDLVNFNTSSLDCLNQPAPGQTQPSNCPQLQPQP